MVGFEVVEKHEQWFHGVATDKQNGDQMIITTIYGLHTVETRIDLWTSLVRLNSNIQDLWCVLGDFNAVLTPDDRFQGRPITNYETQDFSAYRSLIYWS